jgi:hypothetical protein
MVMFFERRNALRYTEISTDSYVCGPVNLNKVQVWSQKKGIVINPEEKL